MLFCPAALPLSTSTLHRAAKLIRSHRKTIGLRWRLLDAGTRALLTLAYLRNGERLRDPAAGFGLSAAAAWRRTRETIALPGHGPWAIRLGIARRWRLRETAACAETCSADGKDPSMPSKFDHPADLIDAGLAILTEHMELLTYSDFVDALADRTGSAVFNLNNDYDRSRLGDLLGVITTRHRQSDPTNRNLMLSALVHTKGGGPGNGFYELACDLGLLRHNASDFTKMEFWVRQVNTLRDSLRSGRGSGRAGGGLLV